MPFCVCADDHKCDCNYDHRTKQCTTVTNTITAALQLAGATTVKTCKNNQIILKRTDYVDNTVSDCLFAEFYHHQFLTSTWTTTWK